MHDKQPMNGIFWVRSYGIRSTGEYTDPTVPNEIKTLAWILPHAGQREVWVGIKKGFSAVVNRDAVCAPRACYELR